MIRGVLGSRASIGGVLGSGRGGAAAAWYLAGGVSAANCIAAYTPKGAASLAASYDNNAAPGNGLADGTYDAAPGVAPTFAAATGWTLNGSSQYLTTGIVPNSGWSMIVRYSDCAGDSGCLCGSYGGTGDPRFFVYWRKSNAQAIRYYGYGNAFPDGGAIATSGVQALAGGNYYFNGSVDASSAGTWTGTGAAIAIGARNGNGTIGGYFNGKIQAFAIYNVTLSAAQVAALSTAMAAL